MDQNQSVTLSYGDLLDLLTTAAQLGRNECQQVQTRGEMTVVIERRMSARLAQVSA